MRASIAPASLRPPTGRRWRRSLVAVGILVAAVVAVGQQFGAWGILVNPCTGEMIALSERPQLLPHRTPDQGGSREVSVNAVGVSGIGSRGTYYLPLGTGKAVLTFANGTLDFAAGGNLELIGRGNQSQDFLYHGIAHLKVSITGGLYGSGLTMQTRCG